MTRELEHLIKKEIGHTTETEACVNCRHRGTLVTPQTPPTCSLHERTIGAMPIDLKGRCKFWVKEESPCG